VLTSTQFPGICEYSLAIHSLKVKLFPCLITSAPSHKDVWGNGDVAPVFLTSALDGVQWSVSSPGRFILVKEPTVPIE
jgi:hypothetical protein